MNPLGRSVTVASIARRRWDVVVVGGGITGAGIFREAARAGLETLLLEGADFGSGTSSRSANLIHGGLRYLEQGELGLVRRATRARNELIRRAPGLVHPLRFVLSMDARDRGAVLKSRLGLWAYDLLSGTRPRSHAWRPPADEPSAGCGDPGRLARFEYDDAITDDVRLVLRLVREGCALGGTAVSYAPVERVVPILEGRAAHVRLRAPDSSRAIEARAVVTATGPASRGFGSDPTRAVRVRRIRGTHLVLRRGVVPLRHALAGYHPTSGQAVYMVPWQGVTIVGTTHEEERSSTGPPTASLGEIRYLLAGARHLLPGRRVGQGDVQAVYSGVRPIADGRNRDPSRASRDHVVVQDGPVVAVHGGKLTTFHPVALRVMTVVSRRLGVPRVRPSPPVFDAPSDDPSAVGLDRETHRRFRAYYGPRMIEALNAAHPLDRHPIHGTGALRGELRWILRHEGVRHLDDLMLRRFRIGITRPNGALHVLPRMERTIREELGWPMDRWAEELRRYRRIWSRDHAQPQPRARPARRRDTRSLVEAG